MTESCEDELCGGDCGRPFGVLPQEDAVRKAAPMYRGLLGYFPMALFRVAAHSRRSDEKHNPGNPEGPTWAREKSGDHLDCIVRHLCELHTDPDYHLAAIAWRALAALQEHCERQGAAPGASSRFPEPPPASIGGAEAIRDLFADLQGGPDASDSC